LSGIPLGSATRIGCLCGPERIERAQPPVGKMNQLGSYVVTIQHMLSNTMRMATTSNTDHGRGVGLYRPRAGSIWRHPGPVARLIVHEPEFFCHSPVKRPSTIRLAVNHWPWLANSRQFMLRCGHPAAFGLGTLHWKLTRRAHPFLTRKDEVRICFSWRCSALLKTGDSMDDPSSLSETREQGPAHTAPKLSRSPALLFCLLPLKEP
jgi:hypothetical protein